MDTTLSRRRFTASALGLGAALATIDLAAEAASSPANADAIGVDVPDVLHLPLMAGDVLVSAHGAAGDGVWLTAASMSSGSSVLTDANAAFTVADIGKQVLVSGAGAGGDSLSTTIKGFIDATHVKLADSANTSVSSIPAVYGSDDTAAIQDASDAAASANGTLYFDAKTYVVAGSLVQGGNRKSNSQITWPTGAEGSTSCRGRVHWKGARDSRGDTDNKYLYSDGTIIVSTLVGASYSNNYGVPSVIGGATYEQAWIQGNPGASYSKHAVQLEDLIIRTPRGPSLSGVNGELMGGLTRRRCQVDTLEWGYDGGGYKALAPQPQAAGVILPGQQCPGYSRGDSNKISGYYVGLAVSEHLDEDDAYIKMCVIALGIRRPFQHVARLGYVSVELCASWVSGWDPSGSSSQVSGYGGMCPAPSPPSGNTVQQYPSPLVIDILDTEYQRNGSLGGTWTVLQYSVNDPHNCLGGRIGYFALSNDDGYTEQYIPRLAAGSALGMRLARVGGRQGGEVLARAICQDNGNTVNYATINASTPEVWTKMGPLTIPAFAAPNPGWVEIELDGLFQFTTGSVQAGLYFGIMDADGYVPNSATLLSYETIATGSIRRLQARTFVYGLIPRNVIDSWRPAWALKGASGSVSLWEGGMNASVAPSAFGPVSITVKALTDLNTTQN